MTPPPGLPLLAFFAFRCCRVAASTESPSTEWLPPCDDDVAGPADDAVALAPPPLPPPPSGSAYAMAVTSLLLLLPPPLSPGVVNPAGVPLGCGGGVALLALPCFLPLFFFCDVGVGRAGLAAAAGADVPVKMV